MMTDAHGPDPASRPAVSVVMPFAGDAEARSMALRSLDSIRTAPGDELVFVDNSVPGGPPDAASNRIATVHAAAMSSSYYARNEGALRSGAPWIAFLDSDCVPPADLLDALFAGGIDAGVGAIAPAISGLAGESGIAARWATERRILEPAGFLERDPPAAPTACLLVRREAWEAVGGFMEVRSGADLDFCWRLQEAGWLLEHRPAVRVEHRQRPAIRGVLRQMSRYAAGNEWQRRRGAPAPRPERLLRNLLRAPAGAAFYLLTLRGTEAAFRVLDGLVAGAQLAGRLFANAAPRPASERGERRLAVATDIFPAVSETFIREEIEALRGIGWDVRVEAVARPQQPALLRGGERLPVDYVEDAGTLEKAQALIWLALRHPLRTAGDLGRRRRFAAQERMPLRAIAPAARRLAREGDQHLHVHFAALAAVNALRAGRLAGVPVSVTAHAREVYAEPLGLEQKLAAAAFVAATSEYVAKDLRALAPAQVRVAVIPMGVDCRAFRRSRPYPGGAHVVAVGRLVEKKGFDVLVRAMPAVITALPAARLTLAGEGPLAAQLADLADEAGVTRAVQMRAVRSPAEVAGVLEEADVFALPCVVAADGDRDSMPVAIKEALAAEVPVVATGEVGIPEVVQPGWGTLVAPRDPRALAGAIVELFERSPAERAAMGTAGRRFVCERFTVAAQARLLDELIAGVT
jgi:glycosyltransferase involved in cell wall biosynthesis